MARITLAAALVAGFVGLSADPAAAQAPVRVVVNSVRSQQNCTTYAVTSGSESFSASRGSAVAADAYGYAAASRSSLAWSRQWRTDLVRDCQSNFPQLRAALVAALSASGRVSVQPAGTRGVYSIDAQVSAVGTTSSSSRVRGNAEDSSSATLTVEFRIAGPDRGIVFGNSIVKSLTFDEQVDSGDTSTRQSMSDTAAYSRLQRELSLAVSRAVAFHFDPLRVVAVAGRRIRVNYGAPLLTQGSTVIVDGGVGSGLIRGNVVATSGTFAEVEAMSGRSLAAVRPGSTATFAEPEDPAGNIPAYESAELPN